MTLGSRSKVSNLCSNKFSMNFSLSKGTFKGKVTDPASGRSSSFSGAVLTKMGAGYGFLLGTNECSQVVLAP